MIKTAQHVRIKGRKEGKTIEEEYCRGNETRKQCPISIGEHVIVHPLTSNELDRFK
jgi:hypothetical protein